MEKIILNETPVRTSRNYNINNIKLDNIKIPEIVSPFNNLDITGSIYAIKVEKSLDDIKLTYGIGEELTSLLHTKCNQNIRVVIDSNVNKEITLEFMLDENNLQLLEKINIVVRENSIGTVIIKYLSKNNIDAFHNGIINVDVSKNATVNVVLVNLLNLYSDNFLSLENKLEDSAKLNYTIIDFGGKNSITNYYSNLLGKFSDNNINSIYLGKDSQLFDLNYIGELRGEKSNINLEVQGALKDEAKKHFKGTIDFKKGCKKAKGNENEFCTILSDKAKSIALPMLLCSEEDVEGNHSSAAGKIGPKELFYIMSRGFELKEAMKLIVRAKFNNILSNIKNEELREEILEEIDKRLD